MEHIYEEKENLGENVEPVRIIVPGRGELVAKDCMIIALKPETVFDLSAEVASDGVAIFLHGSSDPDNLIKYRMASERILKRAAIEGLKDLEANLPDELKFFLKKLVDGLASKARE